MKTVCIKKFPKEYYHPFKKNKEYEYELIYSYGQVAYRVMYIDVINGFYFFQDDFDEFFITLENYRKMKIIKINKEAIKLNM